jgi:hypothetical protein
MNLGFYNTEQYICENLKLKYRYLIGSISLKERIFPIIDIE